MHWKPWIVMLSVVMWRLIIFTLFQISTEKTILLIFKPLVQFWPSFKGYLTYAKQSVSISIQSPKICFNIIEKFNALRLMQLWWIPNDLHCLNYRGKLREKKTSNNIKLRLIEKENNFLSNTFAKLKRDLPTALYDRIWEIKI